MRFTQGLARPVNAPVAEMARFSVFQKEKADTEMGSG
jgi:hypothetical protein